jgi:uncharacterized protein
MENETAIIKQEFVSPTQPIETGKAPGLKVKLLSTNGQAKNYILIFSPGDEVRSGFKDFAQQYNVKSAHYTGVGDIFSAKVGFFDYGRKMFKVIPIEKSEVVSFIGNIAMFNGQVGSHTHASFAGNDGYVKGGHLLELLVGPTMEVFVTVEPTSLYRKFDKTYESELIDPDLEE